MPDEKGLGSKLLGLFVETGEAKPEEPEVSDNGSAAEVVAQLAATSGVKAQPRPVAPAASVPRPSGPITPATVDFDAVFRQAGVDAQELDRVRKSEDLLKSLPDSTPAEVKRQIVEASLRAFGFDISKIAAAAEVQLKALDTFVRDNEQQTVKAIADAKGQINQLEEKVIGLRADIDKRSTQLAQTSAAAELRKEQVRRVLEFFAVSTPPKGTP